MHTNSFFFILHILCFYLLSPYANQFFLHLRKIQQSVILLYSLKKKKEIIIWSFAKLHTFAYKTHLFPWIVSYHLLFVSVMNCRERQINFRFIIYYQNGHTGRKIIIFFCEKLADKWVTFALFRIPYISFHLCFRIDRKYNKKVIINQFMSC